MHFLIHIPSNFIVKDLISVWGDICAAISSIFPSQMDLEAVFFIKPFSLLPFKQTVWDLPFTYFL